MTNTSTMDPKIAINVPENVYGKDLYSFPYTNIGTPITIAVVIP